MGTECKLQKKIIIDTQHLYINFVFYYFFIITVSKNKKTKIFVF